MQSKGFNKSRKQKPASIPAEIQCRAPVSVEGLLSCRCTWNSGVSGLLRAGLDHNGDTRAYTCALSLLAIPSGFHSLMLAWQDLLHFLELQ